MNNEPTEEEKYEAMKEFACIDAKNHLRNCSKCYMPKTTIPEHIEEQEIVIRNLGADFHAGMISPQKYSDGIVKALLSTADLSRTEALKEAEEAVRDYQTKQYQAFDGVLPFVVFGGKADEKEKRSYYEEGVKDTMKVIASLRTKE